MERTPISSLCGSPWLSFIDRITHLIALGLSVVLFISLPCRGQVFTATVTGVVTDTSGGVIPKAAVVLTNVATNVQRRSTAGEDGRYTFSQVLPGAYTLAVAAAGFERYLRTGVSLGPNQTAELDVRLQIGSTAQSVQVTASTPLLNTQNANQAVNIETQTLEDLPMSVRTPFRIVWANAGVSEAFHGATSATTDQNQDRFGMNGGRTESTAIILDGVPDTTTSQWNALYVSPTLGDVAEVHLVRNSYDAQYGVSGGGVFSIVTKSGSNQLHGGAFEFLQNSALDANSFFNNATGRHIPYFEQNQFGGYLGGPIWKSKHLYFFFSYEGLRQGSPATDIATVPTQAQRNGDFSSTLNTDGTLQTIFNPFTTQPNGAGGFTRTAFQGNVIPPSMFNGVGAKVLALYPLPNLPGSGATLSNNWVATGKNRTVNDHFDGRVDWSHGDWYTTYFRWSAARQDSLGLPLPQWGIGNPNQNDREPRGQAVFGNTFLLSPTFVINALFGYGYWTEIDVPIDTASATQIGMPASQVAEFMGPKYLPQFTLSNYSTLGFGTDAELYHPERTGSLEVNATKQLGAHTVKFGGDAMLSYQNGPGAGGWISAPAFQFDQGLTSGPTVVPGLTTSGNAVASLLLGYGSGGSSPYTAPLAEGHHDFAIYGEDSWHVTNRLSLNPGLRWEVQGPTTDRFNRFSTFELNAPAPISIPGINLQGAMAFNGSGNIRGMWYTNWHDFAPRLGVAYKLTRKLVIRTGYGIFYVPSLGDENPIGYSTNTPWLSTAGGDGIHPGDPISDPFPNGFIPEIGQSQGAATGLGQGITEVPRNRPDGYIENYSVDFQYEISNNTLLELGYAGNQGHKLSFGWGTPLDQLPAQDLSLGTQLQQLVPNPFYGVISPSNGATLTGPTVPYWRLLVPYPQYAGVSLDGSTPGAMSSYNALVARFTKRFSNGLNLIASYQWSKAIDDASETQAWEVGDPGPRNSADWDLERSISAHDMPQALAVTLLYQLPVGRGKAIGSHMNRIANALVGGWEISSLITYQSGYPIGMSAPGNGFGFAYNPPNINNPNSVSISNQTVAEWFNTNAFSKPAPFTIGTAPRRITELRQDGTHNTDFSLEKNFILLERLRFQFRADFLNLMNSPQFSAPNTSVGSSTFGEVTSQANLPRAIQFGLKLSF